MVVGDGNGRVGLGYGKAKEVPLAIQKGTEEAKKNLFDVPLAGSTITHPIIGINSAGRVLMKPAAAGTGVIAGGAARIILEEAGVHDILCKSLGSSNAINVARATINGLKSLQRPDVVAARRGLAAEDFVPEGRAELVQRAQEAARRRRGRTDARPHSTTPTRVRRPSPSSRSARRSATSRRPAARCAPSASAASATPTSCPTAPRSAGMIARVPHLIDGHRGRTDSVTTGSEA